MSDAIGGVVNIALVVFFIIAIASYMAFNVNYEKAFNVKNEIVSLYEEYEGRCNSECKGKIDDYESQLGYGRMDLSPQGNEVCFDIYGYCVEGVTAKKKIIDDPAFKNENIHLCYFKVRTLVLIDIPIIDNLMNLGLFQVTGQTKTMKLYTGQECVDIVKGG